MLPSLLAEGLNGSTSQLGLVKGELNRPTNTMLQTLDESPELRRTRKGQSYETGAMVACTRTARLLLAASACLLAHDPSSRALAFSTAVGLPHRPV
jgi:hypothetical protein